MAICKNCGVDLGEGNDKCPLCEAETNQGKLISPADIFNMSKKENIKQLYELGMLLFGSAIIITIAIDAVFGSRGMNWSLLTTTCIGYVMAGLTIIHFFKSHPYWLVGTAMAATLIFLCLLDRFTGNLGWFRLLGGPISASVFVLAAIVIFLSSLSRYKGLNIIALILLALAVFVVIIEYYADKLLTGTFDPKWSVVTAASLIILAGILVFVHYRLKRGRSLGRLFHV